MQATIRNLSTFRRQHWATVTFPRTAVADYSVECTFITYNGMRWRAVRGRTVGNKTTYRVQVDMEGSEEINGKLANEPIQTLDKIPPFKAHKWVVDDIQALLPSIGPEEELLSFNEIDASPAHRRYHIIKKDVSRGLIFEWWADILHDDPVVPCKGKIVWSDRNDPRPNRLFQAYTLTVRAREFFVLDFADKKGMTPAIKDDEGAYVAALNDKLITLNDGAGLPLSLNMLCFMNKMPDNAPDPEDIRDEDVQSIQNLQAGAMGGMVSIAHGWEDKDWLSAENAPRISSEEHYNLGRADDLRRWEDSLRINTGLFEPNRFGIGKTPGQTGNQDDFGATKGSYLIRDKDLRFVPAFQYAAYTELFRGFNHYEDDGSKLDLENHPNWVTWNGTTHWHTSVSTDRLGKDPAMWTAPGTGWWGYDDQHRSQNSFAAYAMISDDPLIDDQITHMLTTDSACYRIRFPSYGSGATRAQGRQLQAWSQMILLTEGQQREDWRDIIDIRLGAMQTIDTLNLNGPMKVLSKGGPDGRKRVYRDGELAGWTSMWELGLAVVGLYCLWKKHPTAVLTEILTKVCNTIVQFGYFKEGNTFYTVADLAWFDGEVPSGGMNVGNTWDWQGDDPRTQQLVADPGAGGVNSWTFAGILAAREFLDAKDIQLDHYIQSITGGNEATSRTAGEWWSIVERVTKS